MLRKLFLTLFCFTMLMGVANVDVYANTPSFSEIFKGEEDQAPCDDPCTCGGIHCEPWSDIDNHIFSLPNHPNCRYLVQFKTRKNCDGMPEFKITDMFQLAVPNAPDCDNLMSDNERLRAAFQDMVIKKLGSLSGTLTNFVSAKIAGCAEFISLERAGALIDQSLVELNPGFFSGISLYTLQDFPGKNVAEITRRMKTCGYACCNTVHDVAYDLDGNVIQIRPVSEYTQPNCRESYGIYNCTDRCESTKIEYSAFNKKQTFNNSSEGNNTISPNPNNGTFKLQLGANISGKFDLIISNQVGEVVFTKSYNKSSDTFTEDFDLNNLNNGVYYYIINANNKAKASGSFIINK